MGCGDEEFPGVGCRKGKITSKSLYFNPLDGDLGFMPIRQEELRAGGDPVDAHVWAQNVGEQDGAIGLLIIFDDGDPGASDS
jgi:hypothetical protein